MQSLDFMLPIWTNGAQKIKVLDFVQQMSSIFNHDLKKYESNKEYMQALRDESGPNINITVGSSWHRMEQKEETSREERWMIFKNTQKTISEGYLKKW